MTRAIVFALSLFLAHTSYCQKLTVTDIQRRGPQIVIQYNLEEVPAGNDLQVQLYSSIDNFVSPLKKVTSGDGGLLNEPGLNKTMVWDYAAEYPNYKGKIAVEVRGKAFIPVARFRPLEENQIFKRGRSYTIDWKPGTNKVVDIELYQGSVRVQGESNISNSGSYNLHLLPNLRPATNYRIKISDSRNPEEHSYSDYFEVKRKIPLVLKAIPAAMGVVAISALLSSSSGGGSGSEQIPGAPGLPSGN